MVFPGLLILLILVISLSVLFYQLLCCLFNKNNYISRLDAYTNQVDVVKDEKVKNSRRIIGRDWGCLKVLKKQGFCKL